VTDETTDAVLSRADCMELLSSKRRQTVVSFLATAQTDRHSLESLATAIAQTEQPSDLGARPAARVCLSLHHIHLPKLDDAAVVDYDADEQQVTYTGSARMEQVLDQLET